MPKPSEQAREALIAAVREDIARHQERITHYDTDRRLLAEVCAQREWMRTQFADLPFDDSVGVDLLGRRLVAAEQCAYSEQTIRLLERFLTLLGEDTPDA